MEIMKDVMRTEEIAAKALEQTKDNRYLLANAIFERVRELSNGAKVLVSDMDTKTHKLPDIAMREIAEGKIKVDTKAFSD